MGEEGTRSSRSQRNACETGPREQTGPASVSLSVKWVPDAAESAVQGRGHGFHVTREGTGSVAGLGTCCLGRLLFPLRSPPLRALKPRL